MKSGLILRSKIFPENTSTVLDNLLSYSSSPCSDYGTLEVKLKFVWEDELKCYEDSMWNLLKSR